MATATAVRMTAEEFLKTENKGFELVCGEPVEVGMGALSAWVGGEFLWHARTYLGEQPVGRLFNSEAGYELWADRPLEVRKPDASVVLSGRLPGDTPPLGWMQLAPDLAVEVVSKNEGAPRLETKIREYLSTGVRLIWVIYPETRTAYVHRADGSVSRLEEADALSGEDVLPGFSLTLAQLFASLPAEAD